MNVTVCQLCPTLCNSNGLYSPWNSPGQNTRVGSLSLLQGIFPTQEWNRGLLHCRWRLYQLSYQGSPKGANGKNIRLPMQEMPGTCVRSLCQEVPLEKEMATHSSMLAWRIPWTEEPGRPQSMEPQRVRHDWVSVIYFTGGRVDRDWVKSEHELQLYKQDFACTQTKDCFHVPEPSTFEKRFSDFWTLWRLTIEQIMMGKWEVRTWHSEVTMMIKWVRYTSAAFLGRKRVLEWFS